MQRLLPFVHQASLAALARPFALLAMLLAAYPANAAGNGCGCSTGEYGVTCCNPG